MHLSGEYLQGPDKLPNSAEDIRALQDQCAQHREEERALIHMCTSELCPVVS